MSVRQRMRKLRELEIEEDAREEAEFRRKVKKLIAKEKMSKPVDDLRELKKRLSDMANSRVLKFRAWDIRNEVMFTQKPKQLLSVFLHLIEQDTIEGGEKFELMQYTGLKDSKGVEIYEGDITHAKDAKTIFKVVFDKGTFGFAIHHTHDKEIASNPNGMLPMHSVLANGGNNFEVIGNIYQNKELLNV